VPHDLEGGARDREQVKIGLTESRRQLGELQPDGSLDEHPVEQLELICPKRQTTATFGGDTTVSKDDRHVPTTVETAAIFRESTERLLRPPPTASNLALGKCTMTELGL
jgi:hypothetical protein